MWPFKKKNKVGETNIGIKGHEVYVEEGPVTSMSAENKHQRDLNRCRICLSKLTAMEKAGTPKNDPLYESWLLEYEQRKLNLKVYDSHHGRAS